MSIDIAFWATVILTQTAVFNKSWALAALWFMYSLVILFFPEYNNLRINHGTA